MWKWKYAVDRHGDPVYDKDGTRKKTKVPCHGGTAENTDATDLGNGVPFEVAIATLNKYGNDRGATKVAGLGFLLGDGFAGVDCDKVLDPATRTVVAPWADDVLNRLDSYTEVSPSGRGFKVIVAATEEDILAHEDYQDLVLHKKLSRHDGTALEIYCEERFFTVTGDHLEGTPREVERRPVELADIYYDHFREKVDDERRRLGGRKATAEFTGKDLDADRVLAVALSAKNADKFRDLWDGKEIKGPSEDDAALASMLAFYCGPDVDLIESVMMQSGRYRPKWDTRRRKGGTWLRMTIEYSVGGCDEYFNWDGWERSREAERTRLREEALDDVIGRVVHDDHDDIPDDPPPSGPAPSPEPPPKKTYDPSDFTGKEYSPGKVGPIRFQRWDELCAIADGQTEDWYVPHWLEFGTLGLFTGLPFSGKSTIVGEMIASSVCGREFYGMPVASCPVLLLDLENKERILVKRIRSCLAGDEGKIQDLLYRVTPRDIVSPLTTDWLKACLAQLREAIGSVGEKGTVLIDTLRSAYAGTDDFDTNSEKAMVTILKALKDLAAETNWAFMVLHHNAKHSNSYSGTTAIAGVADYLWNWQSDKKTLEGTLSVEGRDDYQQPLVLRYDVETRRNVLVGTKSQAAAARKASKDDQTAYHILRHFPHDAQQGITVDEAASRSTLSPKYVEKKVVDYYNGRLLTRVGTGKRGSPFLYSLTTDGGDFVLQVGLTMDS